MPLPRWLKATGLFLALVALIGFLFSRANLPRPPAASAPAPAAAARAVAAAPAAGPAASRRFGGAFEAAPAPRGAAPSRGVALRSRFVRADFKFLEDPASPVFNGDRSVPVALHLFDDVTVPFYVGSTHHIEPGVFTTTGRTDSPLSTVVFARVHGSIVATVVDPLRGQFTIEPTAQPDVYRVYQNDPGSLVCGGAATPSPAASGPALAGSAPAADPAAGAGGVPASRPAVSETAGDPAGGQAIFTADYWSDLAVPASGTRIPVLALYNATLAAKAAAQFGSIDGLRARMEAGIALTNAMMGRARATAYLELVGMAQINFAEPAVPSSTTILDLVSQSPDYATLQLRYRPALTTYLIAADSAVVDFSGVADLSGKISAVIWEELNSTSTPHEFGHNFGMRHNVENDSGTPPVAPYAYGWRLNGTVPFVGDAMSYSFPGIAAQTFQLPAYSDPTLKFQGFPLGDALVADNARVARENTARVAAGSSFQFGAVGDNWISNLSTRGYVGTGDQVLIAGLVVSGTAPKQVVVRGIGPSLGKFGIQQPLANPKIQVYAGGTVIAENDDWHADAHAADVQAVGLAPSDPAESALLLTLAPGAYTVVLSGAGGLTGVALVEAYEMDQDLSRFSYWDSSGGTFTYEHFTSPVEFTYDFSTPSYGGYLVLFNLRDSPPGRFLVTSRLDPTSPVAADPSLEILRVPPGQNPYDLRNSTYLASDDNWGTSSFAALLANSGINGLADQRTAAVVVDTTADYDYWVIAGQGDPNSIRRHSGILDIGVYHITGTTSTGEANRLVNVSTRGVFSSGERVMIAGLVVGGTTSRTVIVRALGPSLAGFGLANVAADPKLTIFDSTGKAVFANDNWASDANASLVTQWGIAPSSALEAALAVTLAPGAYTVVVENKGPDGLGLVEAYEVR